MDSNEIGKRIKAHRVAQGLSQRQLARSVTVTPQALSQYETGLIQPKRKVLLSLADALRTPVEHLANDLSSSQLSSIRILSSRPDKHRELQRLEATLLTCVGRSLELESKLGYVFPWPTLPVADKGRTYSDYEDAEDLAHDIRFRWRLGTVPLSNVATLFESKGIRIVDLINDKGKMKFISCAAYVSISDESWLDFPVIVVDPNLTKEQKRLATCRELLHLILPQVSRTALSTGTIAKVADWFAMSLLLPATALRELLGRRRRDISRFELDEVKQLFGVSRRMIIERCRQVEIVSRDCYQRLLREFATENDNLRKKDISHEIEINNESSNRLQRLALRSVTEGLLSPSQAARLLGIDEQEFSRWL